MYRVLLIAVGPEVAAWMGPGTTVVEDLALLEEMRGVRPGIRTIILSPRRLRKR